MTVGYRALVEELRNVDREFVKFSRSLLILAEAGK